MKRFLISAAICLLAVLPTLKAQDCSNWTNWDLRGSYTFSGNGYIDLAKAFANPNLPSGGSPYTWVGGHVLNGAGGESTPGWIVFNMGGNQIKAEFVDYTYSVNSNCSVLVTFRLKLTGLGVTTGVQTSLKIIVLKPGALQLDGMMVGTTFGTPPGPNIGIETMHRISMQP